MSIKIAVCKQILEKILVIRCFPFYNVHTMNFSMRSLFHYSFDSATTHTHANTSETWRHWASSHFQTKIASSQLFIHNYKTIILCKIDGVTLCAMCFVPYEHEVGRLSGWRCDDDAAFWMKNTYKWLVNVVAVNLLDGHNNCWLRSTVATDTHSFSLPLNTHVCERDVEKVSLLIHWRR